MISCGCAAVIAVAIATPGLRSHTGRSAVAVPAAAHQLASLLGVLRRPQTAADRGFPSSIPVAGPQGATVLTALTRRVGELPGNGAPRTDRSSFSLYLLVTGPSSRSRSKGSDRVQIATVVGTSTYLHLLPGVAASELYEAKSALPTSDLEPPSGLGGTGLAWPAGVRGYWFSIVPDGIARVRWAIAAPLGQGARWKRFTVYPKVQNNVAVGRFVPPGDFRVTVTWSRPDGHVVETFGPATVAGPERPVSQ
jgi:hypothetical protein